MAPKYTLPQDRRASETAGPLDLSQIVQVALGTGRDTLRFPCRPKSKSGECGVVISVEDNGRTLRVLPAENGTGR